MFFYISRPTHLQGPDQQVRELLTDDSFGHVLYSTFGIEVGDNSEVDELIKTIKISDSVTAQMLLREAYEISHRLLESKQLEHPFGLVLANKKESVLEYGPLQRIFGDYKDKGVKDKFGLTVVEFLELPRYIVNMILEICAREVRVDAKTLSDIEKELNGK